MKKYLLILSIVITNLCDGQIKYTSVLYGKITNKEVVKDTDKEMADWLTKIRNAADKIEYTLNYNQNEAYFFANSSLTENDINFNLSAILGEGKLKYYQNNNSKEFREFRDSKRTGKVIVNNEQICKWTLTNETKIIGEHKCFKATTPLYEEGKINEGVTIIAWYTPEIPGSFGPNGYGGLPGLIIELQGFKAMFFVKQINLALNKEPEIDKLLSPKAISKETYMMMVMGTFSKEQLKGIKEVEEKQNK
ncbi:GLPGLI family protein [Flavobacterium psychrophilum]|uniref:GLPGLI family protein n=1 Tax=Flavobacterium psychrophilum (strain ATCC 49511 / DSM 21280 / CIP 103535 / JIP02/86) TaxID=402612 RepID=A6GWH1_FLAPJ|nr:GLPGLI family protein [Flavobacterium psychrophilum]EKT3975091.1 GLPGLI family protein [Flavobacterium psychrophilum]EKT4527379.1 GLPGLI family protein [Flavobacterium psychrophilum]EKT4535269.1 GLPGLI family protein [Flavobacterium psychrophilum]EKT4537766.1 GLPGLI family protein [Flavobacterium psychrophilum]EKT4545869.1 GLPGLI family protein [Flavobacterium psychrophilum]